MPAAVSAASAAWKLRGGLELACDPFLVFGVVNVTPDSFYDGGRFSEHRKAVDRVREMAAAGVHVADVGGESTRPGAASLAAEEELTRVVPVIKSTAALPIALSVDTYKAKVAAACLEAGAVIVNDVSACRFDPELMDVVAQHRPGYVLMHSQGDPKTMQQAPRYDNVVDDILAFLEERLAALVKAGLPEAHVMVDPGVGFGKTLEHNLEILRDIDRFSALGRPVLLGFSNKSLWGMLLDLPVERRGNATQVGTALMAARGVQAHRVHDPFLTLQTLRIVQALASTA